MTSRIRSIVLRVASLAAVIPLSLTSVVAQEIGPAPAGAVPADFSAVPDGMEILTRGVVHEAFAEVVTDPKPGLVVSKQPPEPIDEVPPEFKPEDEGAIWVSGYWVWDDERDDFFWQSGVWRVPPPGMRWVAGYWNTAPGGWQWVSGFWVPVATEELRYYAAPPASLESGPNSPSPGDDYFWATGSWSYYDTGYRWQPGYWAPYQENWVWISPRYVWTPAGCVYLPGRWDYRLTRRGCLFAPVYFTQPIYRQPNYVYRPWCALNTPNLFVHLWVRPNYGHFYFGNYYGSNWNNWGVTPWCQYRPYRNCYDPMLTQLQCHYRQQGVNYINRLDGWHNHYAGNVSARPPRTWNDQVRLVNNTNITNIQINKTNINNIATIKQNILAVNLQDASRRNDMPVKFARLDGATQKQAINLAKETREFRQQRISVERAGGNLPDLVKENLENRSGGRPDFGQPEPGKNSDLGQRGENNRGPDKRGQRSEMQDKVRLKLPTTQVTDIARQQEKLAPPNLSQPIRSKPLTDLSGNLNRSREEGRGTLPGSKAKGLNPSSRVELPGENSKQNDQPQRPQPMPKERENPRPPVTVERPRPAAPQADLPNLLPKVELPQPRPEQPMRQPRVEVPQPRIEIPQPKVEIPRPQPKVEIPQPSPERPMRQPRVEVPQPRIEIPQPKVEIPRPRPKVEIPQPKPRLEQPQPRPERPMRQPRVEIPQPRVEAPRPKPERPQEQPQLRLDIPRPRVQPESAPRIQLPNNPAPRLQTPRPEGPRPEPRRGGESKPRGDRKKP